MLKAIVIDSSAIARGLLCTMLSNAGYDVCATSHTSAQGLALLIKHQPQLTCIAREQVEESNDVVRSIRQACPKTLIFMMTSGIDAATLQAALAAGVNAFMIKPFNANTVLKTIRNTVIATVRKQQAASTGLSGNAR